MYIFIVYIEYMLFKKSNKVFIHADCDCFFASCEILRNPKLKWKMVWVGSEIIIASSYEAKRIWIKTGTPIWEARKILWDKIHIFSPDHNYYSKVSDKLMNFLRYNTFSFRKYSIDEAFCEITGLPEMYKLSLDKYLKLLQKNILEYIWIPVSIWCSNTRLKAKIYSKINKPYGIYIWLDKDKEKKLFEELKISDVPYIWRSTTEKLKYSCKNIYDFVSLWFWDIKKMLGKNWTDIWLELSWVTSSFIKDESLVKSISRSRSFNKQITNDFYFLKAQFIYHFDIVYEEIVNKNIEIKEVSVMFRDKAFRVEIFSYKFPFFTSDRTKIFSKLLDLIRANYNNSFLYRSTWVIFSDFKYSIYKQLSIFDEVNHSSKINRSLQEVINKINKKYQRKKISFWFSSLDSKYDAKLKLVD